MSNNSIITSLAWIKKGWARSIPLEYESITEDKEMQKVAKVAKSLKDKGQLTGEETIKEETKMIEDNMQNIEATEDGTNIPMFSEDLKNYYTKDDEMTDDNLPREFDDISDEEQDDFTIHPTDSLIACTTAQDDFFNLEVYIYDESTSSLFVHHDINLTAGPLCIEWLPMKNNQKANYALLGSFQPEIEIWNLDILDVLEPEIVLGRAPKDSIVNTDLIHTDSVMSLALNPINVNKIASGGADGKVLIWDLNALPYQAAEKFPIHTDKVQCVKWNKMEENVLATGSFDKTIKMTDTRAKQTMMTINLTSDIECLDWSPLNKFTFLSSFEDGRIDLYDLRKVDSVVSFQGHKKEATSVSFSPQKENLFFSCGRDSRIKIWDSANINEDKSCKIVLEKLVKKSTGELFCGKFAEDCDYTIAVGGSKGELYLWELTESPIFCSQFGLKFDDNVEMPDELNNLKKKKKMLHGKK